MAGLGIGWLVAFVAGPIFGAAEGSSYPLVIEPESLAIGATAGLVISLVTIWVTSLRIARLNIIRAIRDLPEPKIARHERARWCSERSGSSSAPPPRLSATSRRTRSRSSSVSR